MMRAVVLSLLCLAPLSGIWCPAVSSNAREVAAAADNTIAASCHVEGCSGTAITWAGRSYIVTAEHCFEDGQSVQFTTGDRLRGGTGTVIAVDGALDLALVDVDPNDITGRVSVPADLPDGDWLGIGYPEGRGPSEWRGEFLGAQRITNLPRPRWAWRVKRGRFRHGSSGSGVFRGGRLVAVATHMNDDDETVYACPLHDIRAFLARAGREQPGRTTPATDGTASTITAVGGPESWGDRDRTREILAIKEQLKKLAGTPGPPGPAGPPGLGMDPDQLEAILERMEAIETWQRNFRATVRVRVHPKKETR